MPAKASVAQPLLAAVWVCPTMRGRAIAEADTASLFFQIVGIQLPAEADPGLRKRSR